MKRKLYIFNCEKKNKIKKMSNITFNSHTMHFTGIKRIKLVFYIYIFIYKFYLISRAIVTRKDFRTNQVKYMENFFFLMV